MTSSNSRITLFSFLRVRRNKSRSFLAFIYKPHAANIQARSVRSKQDSFHDIFRAQWRFLRFDYRTSRTMLTQRPGQLLPLMSFEAERLEERGRRGGQVRRRAGRRRAVPMPSCVLTVPRERAWDWRARASNNRMRALLPRANSISRSKSSSPAKRNSFPSADRRITFSRRARFSRTLIPRDRLDTGMVFTAGTPLREWRGGIRWLLNIVENAESVNP